MKGTMLTETNMPLSLPLSQYKIIPFGDRGMRMCEQLAHRWDMKSQTVNALPRQKVHSRSVLQKLVKSAG